jgi:hypothetical protein
MVLLMIPQDQVCGALGESLAQIWLMPLEESMGSPTPPAPLMCYLRVKVEPARRIGNSIFLDVVPSFETRLLGFDGTHGLRWSGL